MIDQFAFIFLCRLSIRNSLSQNVSFQGQPLKEASNYETPGKQAISTNPL